MESQWVRTVSMSAIIILVHRTGRFRRYHAMEYRCVRPDHSSEFRTPTPTALDSPGMCQREPSPTKSAIIGRTPSPFGRRTDGLPPKSVYAHDRGPSPTKRRSEWRGGGGTESPTKIDQRPAGSALQVERRGGSRMSSR